MCKMNQIKQMCIGYNKSANDIFGELIKQTKMKTYLKGLYTIASYGQRLLKLNKVLGNKLYDHVITP